ncbi:MAG TPA: hypothetical protein VJ028_00925 [Patescibacteria group bacterium]|nr:hypothetical protein [Patescibacteria group bacterium]
MNKLVFIVIIIALIIAAFILFLRFPKFLSSNRQKKINAPQTSINADKTYQIKLMSGCAEDSSPTNYDKYGGWKKIRGQKTEFFHTEMIDGKWWLVTPDGYGFISKGVNAFGYQEGKEKEGIDILRGFGLNTIGAWSIAVRKNTLQEKIPYGFLLDLLKTYAFTQGIDVQDQKNFPDIFNDDFEKSIYNTIEAQSESLREHLINDPYLIGWWTDNELRWPQEKNHILDVYLRLSASAPGRMVAEKFLKEKFGAPILPKEAKQIEEARDGFIEIAVKQYAKITHDVIKKYDKNHLILGERLFFTPSAWKNTMPERMGGFEAIGRAVRGYFDIISINSYFDENPIVRLRKMYDQFQGPLLISEFNIQSSMKDQGKRGEEEWLAKEKISVIGYKNQIPSFFAEPYIVGYHWFPYKNYLTAQENNHSAGLVDYYFKPREELLKTFKEVNSTLEITHKCAQSTNF